MESKYNIKYLDEKNTSMIVIYKFIIIINTKS